MDRTHTVHEIPLRDGFVALVDKADRELVAGFIWSLTGLGYVMAHRSKFSLYLHRLIIGAGLEDVVDHINGNPLDNRSCNLRLATRSQNSANRGADRRRLGTSSEYKGVSFHKDRQKWAAYIHFQGKTRALGRFSTEDDAARAYNKAALEVWGEFARLNDVPDERSKLQ